MSRIIDGVAYASNYEDAVGPIPTSAPEPAPLAVVSPVMPEPEDVTNG